MKPSCRAYGRKDVQTDGDYSDAVSISHQGTARVRLTGYVGVHVSLHSALK